MTIKSILTLIISIVALQASAREIVDSSFKDIVKYKMNEVRNIASTNSTAMLFGESKPPLSSLANGFLGLTGQIKNEGDEIGKSTLLALLNDNKSPSLMTEAERKEDPRIKFYNAEKSCAYSLYIAGDANYHSPRLCTPQVVSREQMQSEILPLGFKVTSSTKNMDLGTSPNGSSFMAVYEKNNKLKYLIFVYNFTE